MIVGKMAVVDFDRSPQLCNLTACSSDPCSNNGRCEVQGSTFVCHCPREWTGRRCEIDVDECRIGQYRRSLFSFLCISCLLNFVRVSHSHVHE